MNRIFFTNKAHTRKRGIPNIRPGNSLHELPIEFFDEPGFTLIVNPRLVRGSYFMCEFFAIINNTVRRVSYVLGREYTTWTSALDGRYNKYNNGFIHIESGHCTRNISQIEKDIFMEAQKSAISLVYEGIAEFERYFLTEEGQLQ